MKSRHVSFIVALMLAGIISISIASALTSINMPETAKLNENIAISINPDSKGIYQDVYFSKDSSIVSKITLAGCLNGVCYGKQVISYKIPSGWKGIYSFLAYDYKKGEWLAANFTITSCGNSACEKDETEKSCPEDCKAESGTEKKAGETTGVSYNPICKYIKFQNKSMFDNATLELCKKMDEAKKKAIGKGKLKKPKGIELKESRILEKQGQGTIKFKNSFDVDSEEVGEESGNANVYISDGIVAINTDEVPELDQPATIILYNLSLKEMPVIYYSEKFTTRLSEVNTPCPLNVCTNINYDNVTGTLTFDVTHFSSYAAGYWAINPYKYIYSWPYSLGACSVDVDCKPTAYCSKEVNCEAYTYSGTTTQYYYYGSNDLSDSAPRYIQRCNYKPAAGTENSTCSLYTRYSRPCSLELNNYCEEGYTYKEEKGGSYGDSWCMDVCEKAETCGTCAGTDACTKSYCSYDVFDSCCNQDSSTGLCTTGDWSSCIKQARESCLADNVYTGSPDTYFCKPKTCSSETGKLGACFESVIVNNITTNYSLNIGDPFCSDRNIKVCNNQNNDPCGEWEQTSIGCNAERNETEKKCYDNTGTTQDYCSSQEILNKYSPLSGQVYNISLTDMYGYHSYSWWGINYSLNLKVQEQKCNITQINCTPSGMVCNSEKRACNSLPTASTSLEPLNSSYPYVEQGVPTNLSDLNCTVTLADKDIEDKTLSGDYKVTRKYVDDSGNMQLATLMSGQGQCTKQIVNGVLSSSCKFQVPIISHNSIKPGDIINCSDPAGPYDGYDYGKSGSDFELIKPNVVLSVDKGYLEDKKVDIDEYLKPVKINESGQEKDYLVVTEYDTMECSIKNSIPAPLGMIDFRLLNANKTIQCGSECKAKFEVGQGKDIAALPRGQKIKCSANVLGVGKSFSSDEVAVAEFNYYFIPLYDAFVLIDVLKEQFNQYLSVSALDEIKAKPVYFKSDACPINFEGMPINLISEIDSKEELKTITNFARTLFVRDTYVCAGFPYDSSKDRVIGLPGIEQKSYIRGGFASGSYNHLLVIDWTGDFWKLKFLDESSGAEEKFMSNGNRTLAHELGHTYGLADEYHYGTYKDQGVALNKYPECCVDSPAVAYKDEDTIIGTLNCWGGPVINNEMVEAIASYLHPGDCAGSPLPKDYNPSDVITTLGQEKRSIMGNYRWGDVYDYPTEYPKGSLYPLSETKGMIPYKSASCGIGECTTCDLMLEGLEDLGLHKYFTDFLRVNDVPEEKWSQLPAPSLSSSQSELNSRMDRYLEQIKNNELKNIPQEPSLDSGAIEVLKEILGAEFAVFEHECGHLFEAFKKGGKAEISMMPLQNGLSLAYTSYYFNEPIASDDQADIAISGLVADSVRLNNIANLFRDDMIPENDKRFWLGVQAGHTLAPIFELAKKDIDDSDLAQFQEYSGLSSGYTNSIIIIISIYDLLRFKDSYDYVMHGTPIDPNKWYNQVDMSIYNADGGLGLKFKLGWPGE